MIALQTFASLLVVLGILVFVHEAGHFLAAKWAGVWVHRFALGIGNPIPGLADPVAVLARGGDETCEFAFVPAAYTAVRAWLESSPPGYNSNVA